MGTGEARVLHGPRVTGVVGAGSGFQGGGVRGQPLGGGEGIATKKKIALLGVVCCTGSRGPQGSPYRNALFPQLSLRRTKKAGGKSISCNTHLRGLGQLWDFRHRLQRHPALGPGAIRAAVGFLSEDRNKERQNTRPFKNALEKRSVCKSNEAIESIPAMEMTQEQAIA